MEPEIISKQITDFSFHIQEELKQVQAEVDTQVRYGTPVQPDDNSALMSIRMDFHAENPDDFRSYIEEHIVFAFAERPEDFEAELEKLFQTTGLSVVSDELDKALDSIGKPPVCLYKNADAQSRADAD